MRLRNVVLGLSPDWHGYVCVARTLLSASCVSHHETHLSSSCVGFAHDVEELKR